MAMKIKGIYKGFKYISQIFVVKEREMEIGYPTDVKHVAHIGWDGPSGSQPSWMSDFKSTPDFSTTSALSNPRDSNSVTYSPWSSQDYDNSMGHQSMANVFNDSPSSDLPNASKKPKRKKKTTTTSKSSSSASRSSRSLMAKATTYELQPTPNLQAA